VLLMAQGLSGVEIAERIGYTVIQVSRIRRRFAEGGLAGLYDRPKSGRPLTVTARKRAQIVALTLKPPGPGLTHWTSRDLARKTGVSHTTVHRIWQAHALQPHRVSTFKFSNSSRFPVLAVTLRRGHRGTTPRRCHDERRDPPAPI
jgi:putative transposase